MGYLLQATITVETGLLFLSSPPSKPSLTFSRQGWYLVKMPSTTKHLLVILLIIATYIKQCHGIGKNMSLTKEIGDAAMHTNKTFVVNCKGFCSDITVNVTVDTGGPNLYASDDHPPQRGINILLFFLHLYRVSHLVADWILLTWIWDDPLSCLVSSYPLYGQPAKGTSQIQFNPTQVRDQMGHPVDKSHISIMLHAECCQRMEIHRRTLV